VEKNSLTPVAAFVDLDPETSPAPPDAVETHISVVMFAGTRAYKLYKPVSLPYIELGTVEARHRVLREELELNRRFSPDVYLGLTALMDEQGAVHDHALVMRRMPADRRLSVLLHTPEAESALWAVARRVAAIHASARPAPAGAAGVEAIRHNWDNNFAALETCRGTVLDGEDLDRARDLATQYLDGRSELFEARAAHGHVVDGHGDLLAQDIFLLDDGPRILDCLAFDEDLRFGDVLADIAFLVMDVEQEIGAGHARRLMEWYHEFSNESHPGSLGHFYVAYRASVRAKVASARCAQGDADAPGEVRRLMGLCLDHLARAQVQLILVGGTPGTGKSTVSAQLGHASQWSVLRSDELRKEIVGMPTQAHRPAEPGEGIYDQTTTGATYALMLERARKLLTLGQTVILDASWPTEALRNEARTLAEETHSRLTEIECITPAATADDRIRRRSEQGHDVSDATMKVAGVMRSNAEPWPQALRLDTDRRIEKVTQEAIWIAVTGTPVPTPEPRRPDAWWPLT